MPSREYQIPDGAFVNETGTRQYQVQDGAFVLETVQAGGAPTADLSVSLAAMTLSAGATIPANVALDASLAAGEIVGAGATPAAGSAALDLIAGGASANAFAIAGGGASDAFDTLGSVADAAALIQAGAALTIVGGTVSAGGKVFDLTQYRPGSDAANDGWTTSTGSGTLASMIDEASPDTADYIQSPVNPTANAAQVAFAGVAEPVNDSNGRVSYIIGADGSNVQTVVRLRQTSGIVAAWSHPATPARWQRYDQTLTEAQMAAITDWGSLTLEIVAG